MVSPAGNTDNLVENNICVTQNKVLVTRMTGGGNVFGYRFFPPFFAMGITTTSPSRYAGRVARSPCPTPST